MFLNQSIIFGTHKKLKYHEKLMGKGAGCGRDGISVLFLPTVCKDMVRPSEIDPLTDEKSKNI